MSLIPDCVIITTCIVGYNKWLSMMLKYIVIMIYQRTLH